MPATPALIAAVRQLLSILDVVEGDPHVRESSTGRTIRHDVRQTIENNPVLFEIAQQEDTDDILGGEWQI